MLRHLGLAPLAVLTFMAMALCLPYPQRWEVGMEHPCFLLCSLFLTLLSL